MYPIDPASWPEIRRLCRGAFASNFYFSVASIGEAGEPHVTPIGSLLLGAPGHGFFFEVFAGGLSRRLRDDQRVCVSAVDSGRMLWVRALLRARFPRRPGVRLYGRAAPSSRYATTEELARWRRQVRLLRWLPGYEPLWGNLRRVRDIEFHGWAPIALGSLTELVAGPVSCKLQEGTPAPRLR